MISEVLLITGTVATGFAVDPAALALVERTQDAWAKVDTLTYRFNKTEQMRDGEVIVEEVAVKLKKPLALYIAAILPRPGQEIIYDSRRDPNRFVVHPGRFPDVTLHLDPRGSLATRGQHHLLTHAGLSYSLETLRRGIRRSQKADEGGALRYLGTTTLWGRKVEIILFEAGDVTPLLVGAYEDEPLFDFAARVGADAYSIFAINPDIGAVNDELEARPYKVPKSYGAKTEFAIDLETGLPIRVTIWDRDGRIYERYEYREMVVNPTLTDRDFDPENPAYDF